MIQFIRKCDWGVICADMCSCNLTKSGKIPVSILASFVLPIFNTLETWLLAEGSCYCVTGIQVSNTGKYELESFGFSTLEYFIGNNQ